MGTNGVPYAEFSGGIPFHLEIIAIAIFAPSASSFAGKRDFSLRDRTKRTSRVFPENQAQKMDTLDVEGRWYFFCTSFSRNSRCLAAGSKNIPNSSLQ